MWQDFPSLYEGEDIEIRYGIYKEEEVIEKDSIILEYQKPAIVGQVALGTLLKRLQRYKDQEIVIYVNDAALYELIRGTSNPKNKEVLELAKETKKQLDKFQNLIITDVSKDRAELMKWNTVLQL
jgi:hypothetical protein